MTKPLNGFLDSGDNRLIWSDEMYRIHGLWREHYTPRIESALAAFHPVDGKRVGALLQETVARRGQLEVAARLRRRMARRGMWFCVARRCLGQGGRWRR